jgi:hypothetical protein
VAELFLQAVLQQLDGSSLQTPGIVGVDTEVEADVCYVLEVGFKIEERSGGGAFGAQTNGGVLVGYFEVQVGLLVHALRLVPLLVRHLDRIIFNAGNIIKTTLSAPFPHPPSPSTAPIHPSTQVSSLLPPPFTRLVLGAAVEGNWALEVLGIRSF